MIWLVSSFNIIPSPKHSIVLDLPWFEETSYPRIQKKANIKYPYCFNSNIECHQISTISLKSLRKVGQKQELSIFAVITTSMPTQLKPSTLLPTKYQEFQDFFNKDKVVSLLEHRPYDYPIDLQPGKDPP